MPISCQFYFTHSIPLCLCPLSHSMVPAPLFRLFHGTLSSNRNILDAFPVSVLRNFPAKSKKIKVRSTLIPPTSRLTNLILARISRKHIITSPYSGVFGPFWPPLTPPPHVRTPIPPYFRFCPYSILSSSRSHTASGNCFDFGGKEFIFGANSFGCDTLSELLVLVAPLICQPLPSRIKYIHVSRPISTFFRNPLCIRRIPISLLSISSLAGSGICEQPSHSLYGPYRRLHTPRGCVCGDRARFSVCTELPARSAVTRAPSDVPASTTAAQIASVSSSRHHLCPLTYSRIATYSLCHNPYTLMPIPLNPYSPIPPILLNPYSPNL